MRWIVLVALLTAGLFYASEASSVRKMSDAEVSNC